MMIAFFEYKGNFTMTLYHTYTMSIKFYQLAYYKNKNHWNYEWLCSFSQLPNCLIRRSCNLGAHKPMKEKNLPFQHINKLTLICSFYNYWCVWHYTIENQRLKLEGPIITWGWGCLVVERWLRQQTD